MRLFSIILLVLMIIGNSFSNPVLTLFSYYERSSSNAIIKTDNNENYYIITTSPASLLIRSFDVTGNLRWEKEITPNQNRLKDILKTHGADFGGIIDINTLGLDSSITKTDGNGNTYRVFLETSCKYIDDFGNSQFDDVIIPWDTKINGSYLYIIGRTCDPNFKIVNGKNMSYVYTFEKTEKIDPNNPNNSLWDFKKSFEFNKEAILFKISLKDGTMVYSSYIGAYRNEEPKALDIDKSGNIYITGYTDYVKDIKKVYPVGDYNDYLIPTYPQNKLIFSSPDISSAPNNSQCSTNKWENPFVLKLTPNSSGGYLLNKIHIFGSYCIDRAFDITVDKNNNIYIAGETYAGGDFDYINFKPATLNGRARNISNPSTSGRDIFVAQFTTNLLLNSLHFLGSSDNDDVLGGIDTDNDGNIYLVGNAGNKDFPLKNQKFTSNNGSCYIVKFKKGSLVREFSTFIDPQLNINSSNGGLCRDMDVSNNGNIYIVGNDGKDAFLYIINGSNQNTVHIEKVLGNNLDDASSVDTSYIGNSYFSGYTDSTNLQEINPLTNFNAIDTQNGNSFIGKLSFKEKLEIKIISGQGTITSNPQGLTCSGNSCSGIFDISTSVTLTAIPAKDYEFIGWEPNSDCGNCDTNPKCTILIDKYKKCVANFQKTSSSGNNNPPNKPTITANPKEGYAPLNVTLTCIATDPDKNDSIVEYEWNILELKTSKIQTKTTLTNQLTQVLNAGEYEVRCKAKDNHGEWSIDSEPTNIFVAVKPSIKSFTVSPNTGFVPLSVQFSWNIDNPSNLPISCDIDANNDGIYEYRIKNCSNSGTQKHTYNSTGNFTAKFTISDGNLSLSKTTNITVKEKFTLSISKLGQGNGNVTSNPSGIDCGKKCSALFENGTTVTLTANPDSKSVFYSWSGDCSSCGKNQVCKIVINANKYCKILFEKNKAPTVLSFKATPSSGIVPIDITFSWNLKDPENDKLTCLLDVDGDGKPDYTINNCDTVKSQKHKYTKTGTYNAKLIVTDSKGNTTTKSVKVQLNTNNPPVISSFTAIPPQGVSPVNVVFKWTVMDKDGDVLTCKLDINNDGVIDYKVDYCEANISSDNSKTYNYNKFGIYPVKLIVSDGKTSVEKILNVSIVDVKVKRGTFSKVIIAENLPKPPKNIKIDYALSFSITLNSGEKSADLEITFPKIKKNAKFYKIVNGKYLDITNQVTVNGNKVKFTIVDNSQYDENPKDGFIEDPIAVGESLDNSNSGGGCTLSNNSSTSLILIVILPALLLLRKRLLIL